MEADIAAAQSRAPKKACECIGTKFNHATAGVERPLASRSIPVAQSKGLDPLELKSRSPDPHAPSHGVVLHWFPVVSVYRVRGCVDDE